MKIYDGYVNILSDTVNRKQERKLESLVTCPLKEVTIPENQAGKDFKTKYGADATLSLAEINNAAGIPRYGIVRGGGKTVIVSCREDFNLTQIDTYKF